MSGQSSVAAREGGPAVARPPGHQKLARPAGSVQPGDEVEEAEQQDVQHD